MVVVNQSTNDVDFGHLQCLKNIRRLTSQVHDTILSKHFSVRLVPDVYLPRTTNLVNQL